MKIGHGTVKKYSREYHRTLKTGEKKKYTTEQIQITVPKNEDIYSNKEEVLIIPQSEIDAFNNLEEELHAIKVANYLYIMEVEKLQKLLDEGDSSEYEKIIEIKIAKITSVTPETKRLALLVSAGIAALISSMILFVKVEITPASTFPIALFILKNLEIMALICVITPLMLATAPSM